MKNSKISEAFSSAVLNIEVKNRTIIDDLPLIQLLYEVLSKEYIHSVVNNGSTENKKSWVDTVFKSWLPKVWMNLMHLLIDEHRFHIIDDITLDFLEKGYDAINVSFGTLTSAKEVKPEALEKIIDIMQEKLKRKVALTVVVDKRLIGGLQLQIEDVVYENSIRSKIRTLRDKTLRSLQGVV